MHGRILLVLCEWETEGVAQLTQNLILDSNPGGGTWDFYPPLGLSSIFPASVGTWGIWRSCPLACYFNVRVKCSTIRLSKTVITGNTKLVTKSGDSPCTNISWCNYGFPWSSEQACQIVSLVPSSLHIITKLHHYDVGHGISILHEQKKHISLILMQLECSV